MNIQLLNHTPNPEQAVSAAARLCYSAASIGELMEKVSSEDQKAFIQKIVGMGHLSVLEHASFTFGIEGISRACSHQLVRHRIASYSQRSQRYVNEEGFEFVTPKSVVGAPSIMKELFEDSGKLFRHDALDAFECAMATCENIYRELVEDFGIPPEDARYVLPNAATTKLVMTMNARELRHFFELRCCERAQWEIRDMAKEMLRLVKDVAPALFVGAGPGCAAGRCPEGKKSCGKMAQVLEEYEGSGAYGREE